MRALRDAYRRFSSDRVSFDEVAAMVRRHIEVHTFASRTGESGVHLVDADSAPFGEFDNVQLAGWSMASGRRNRTATSFIRRRSCGISDGLPIPIGSNRRAARSRICGNWRGKN
jgi:hypothetical protein